VIEATALISARTQAAVFGFDEGLHFAAGHEVNAETGRQIPESMIGRLLDYRDLRRLHRLLLTEKPPVPLVDVRPRRKRRWRSGGKPLKPSVRRRTTAKGVGLASRDLVLRKMRAHGCIDCDLSQWPYVS
jgi:hypothetical protein